MIRRLRQLGQNVASLAISTTCFVHDHGWAFCICSYFKPFLLRLSLAKQADEHLKDIRPSWFAIPSLTLENNGAFKVSLVLNNWRQNKIWCGEFVRPSKRLFCLCHVVRHTTKPKVSNVRLHWIESNLIVVVVRSIQPVSTSSNSIQKR